LTYTPTNLNPGTVYNWYIAPINAGGANTTCSSTNTTTFTTAAATVPACVTNTSPANGATLLTQTSVTLTWPSSSGATSYDVYLWTGATPPATPTTNTTALTYSATGLTAGTLYNWYIAPRNAGGAATTCATANKTTFTTATATGGGNLSPVSNSGGNTAITLPTSSVTLDGSASYDPDGNIVQYYWYQAQGPVSSAIGNNFSQITTASGLTTAGTYVFGLQVKDNSGALAYSFKTVTVNSAGGLVTTVQSDTVTTATATTTTLRIATTLPELSSTQPELSSTVSPNPVASGQMARLVINSDRAGTAAVAVVNISGNIMATQKVKLVAGANTTMLSTSALGQGLYIININGGRKPLNVKLMIH